jgi:transposase InsO family protein
MGARGDAVSVALFVAAQRTDHGIPHATSCRAIGVSESWFYKWRDRPPTPRQERRARLDAEVRRSYIEADGDYGSPRVRADLSEWGWRVSTKTVAASIARQGLVGRPTRRRFRCLTRPDKAARPVPDLVKRDFTAMAINVKWCGDLTEIPTDEGKLYLAHVEDLASRRIPGFAMSEHHDSPLAVAALRMAAAVRGGDVHGVIFHSDHGGEYSGDLFETACRRLGVTQSMGRVGSCFDNAASESFHSTLEFELLRKRRFATRAAARVAVAAYIDRYNRVRRHSSCAMRSPIDYETILAARGAETADAEEAA